MGVVGQLRLPSPNVGRLYLRSRVVSRRGLQSLGHIHGIYSLTGVGRLSGTRHVLQQSLVLVLLQELSMNRKTASNNDNEETDATKKKRKETERRGKKKEKRMEKS